jgi:hypothetical protein
MSMFTHLSIVAGLVVKLPAMMLWPPELPGFGPDPGTGVAWGLFT